MLAADVSTITPESAFQGQQEQSAILSLAPVSEPTFASNAGGGYNAGSYSPNLQQAAFAGGPAPAPPDAYASFLDEQRQHFRLRVELEDCYGSAEVAHGLATTTVWPGSNAPGSSPLAAPVGAMSKQELQHREVYVQNLEHAERFKPVPVHRLQRQLRQAKAAESRQGPKAHHSAFWASCTAIDSDVSQLNTSDRVDVDILELIACAEQCQVSVAAMFFTLQALLAGLAAVAGLMWLGAGTDNSGLEKVLIALEPAFSCLNLVCGELVLIASSLRLCRAWDTVEAAISAGGGSATEHSEDMNPQGEHYARQVIQKTYGLVGRTVANLVFVLCCLMGSRGTVVLLHRPWWSPGGEEEWPGEYACDLLATRCVFGILALAFAYTDLYELISPRVPTSPMAAEVSDVMMRP